MLDLIGTWRLKASYAVVQDTGKRVDLFGPDPVGYGAFEPNGRMIALVHPRNRPPAASNEDIAALFKSMAAYSGRWSIDAEKFVTKVDGAWDPSWVGTEQVRYFSFD